MSTIKTFQDFQEASDRSSFVAEAIAEYKSSDMYRKAVTAQLYYSSDNEAIGKRLGYLERQTQSKVNVIFHRLRNGFFPKAVKKLVLYLMGNGATLDLDIKLKIDKQFDRNMITATINACVDGVVWGLPDLDSLVFFRATEFVPLFDERTNKPMAGIRFWQISADKPIYVELYEAEGITEYKSTKGGMTLTKDTRPYKQTTFKDGISTTVIGGENYGVFPVFPLYANELKSSELNTGLKGLIDAWDCIASDLADGITLIEGIYWIVKNFGGQNTSELLAELQQLKASLVDGSEAGVDNHTIEIPFQAKKMALELYEKQMYIDWLLPNETSDIQITATEYVGGDKDMDAKATLLEWEVAKFIESVLQLKGVDMSLEDFKRRTVTNDSKAVQDISTRIAGESWIDFEEAIDSDPTIPEDRKEALKTRILLLKTGVPPEEDEPEEVI